MNWQFWKKKTSGENAKPKTKAREWWDAILFAVIAATLIRWLIMEAYTIPTSSMENSLLVGDFLFVSKFHYGTRTTSTPLQVPLTHQKIWFTNIPSYVEWIKLPQYRLPGITHVKREDVVVFNVPTLMENNLDYQDPADWTDYPVDLKTNYIKRCVGIPGDTLRVRERVVYASGTPIGVPPEMQLLYQFVSSAGKINDLKAEKLKLKLHDFRYDFDGKNGIYQGPLTASQVEILKKEPYIVSIQVLPQPKGDLYPYYNQKNYKLSPAYKDMNFANGDYFRNWTIDDFGPLWVPKKGATININDSTLTLYGNVILLFDHNDNAKIEGSKLFIDGKEVTQYTFNQDYYFMMGDNRHMSLDSRYWGFVPADHIVGKAFFIWLSLDKNSGVFSKVRWSRFFKMIH